MKKILLIILSALILLAGCNLELAEEPIYYTLSENKATTTINETFYSVNWSSVVENGLLHAGKGEVNGMTSELSEATARTTTEETVTLILTVTFNNYSQEGLTIASGSMSFNLSTSKTSDESGTLYRANSYTASTTSDLIIAESTLSFESLTGSANARISTTITDNVITVTSVSNVVVDLSTGEGTVTLNGTDRENSNIVPNNPVAPIGTETNPYEINNLLDLSTMSPEEGKAYYIILTGDISLPTSESSASYVIPKGYEIHINLNGHILSSDTTDYLIENNGKLSITGSSTDSTDKIIGRIKLAASSALLLDNLTLSNNNVATTAEGRGLIFMGDSGADITIKNSKIIPMGEAFGIEASLIEEGDGDLPISITLDNTIIDLKDSDVGASYAREGAYGRAVGIAINNKYGSNAATYVNLNSFVLNMSNSSIIGNEDKAISTINILLNKIDKVDINITDSRLTTPKNHYPILLNDCGNEESDSTLNILNCFIKGWCGIYVRNGSSNIKGNVRNSEFECITDNSGGSNDFSCFSIHSSLNCTLDISDTSITLGKTSDSMAGMTLFCYQYNNTYGGNSHFRFENCELKYDGAFANDTQIGAIDHLDSELDNSYTMDEATTNSLLAMLEGSRVGIYEEDYPVTNTFVVNYTVYYLTNTPETEII